jgi:tetratricopeptide (TPR) repeat protein
MKDLERAVSAFREAVRINPIFAEAYCEMGLALQGRGQFIEALENLKRGHELGTKRKGWTVPSGQFIRDCERQMDLDGRRPAIPK